MARNRIKELRARESSKKWNELLNNQEAERQEVEQAHIFEYQQFNKSWDEQMANLEQEHARIVQDTEDKHIKELEDNRAKLEQELPGLPKPSAEILNLKKIQENLGNQGE